MSRKVIALSVTLLFVITMDSPAGEPIAGAGSNQRAPVYDVDRSHLWNRLHVALWVRKDRKGNEYGHDLLNPLIWRNTKFLVEGESHRRALAVLDEFLNTRGERRFTDPVKRACCNRICGRCSMRPINWTTRRMSALPQSHDCASGWLWPSNA